MCSCFYKSCLSPTAKQACKSCFSQTAELGMSEEGYDRRSKRAVQAAVQVNGSFNLLQTDFFFNNLFERQGYREEREKEVFHPLVRSPDGHNSWSWADQKPGASFFRVSHKSAGDQARGPSAGSSQDLNWCPVDTKALAPRSAPRAECKPETPHSMKS